MTYQIIYRVNVRGRSKKRVFQHIERRFPGVDFAELDANEYPKFPGTFMAQFRETRSAESHAVLVYGVMKTARTVASSLWSFVGPIEISGTLEFSCVLNNEDADDVVRWASIEAISNGTKTP